MFFIGALLILNSCVNQLTMHARDGERLDGKWRFAREGSGLIEVEGSAGELLVGTFNPVPRHIFFDGYQKAFGGGTIDADGPDVSGFGNAFAGVLGNSNALMDTAYGENYNSAAGKPVRWPCGSWPPMNSPVIVRERSVVWSAVRSVPSSVPA